MCMARTPCSSHCCAKPQGDPQIRIRGNLFEVLSQPRCPSCLERKRRILRILTPNAGLVALDVSLMQLPLQPLYLLPRRGGHQSRRQRKCRLSRRDHRNRKERRHHQSPHATSTALPGPIYRRLLAAWSEKASLATCSATSNCSSRVARVLRTCSVSCWRLAKDAVQRRSASSC